MACTRYTAEEIICHLQAVKLMSAMRQGMAGGDLRANVAPLESEAWDQVFPPQVNKEICDSDWRCDPPPGGLCSLCAMSIPCALTPPSINHLMKDRGKFIVAG